MDFGITSLFENAAAEVRPPVRAPCESLQCRAWTAITGVQRCPYMIEQGDGTCWEHRDYYKGWWKHYVPTTSYKEDIIMMDYQEEIRFQIERGYVSLQDPELDAALRRWTGCHLFFRMLCEYSDFDYSAYPGHISWITYLQTRQVINRIQMYDRAFADLHRLFDRGYVFNFYLIHCLNWIKDNIQAGAPNMIEGLLRTANVTFRDIAGKRQLLADNFKVLRNSHMSEAEDDRYNMCRGRFWLWVSELKAAERVVYEPIRAAVIAAAWAPARMPFWCLDVEEVAEDYPEGLPSKEEWKALCAAC